jgi:hypothetical protein
MPLTITGDLVDSDRTTDTARLVSGRPHPGHTTRLSGRPLDCSSAVSVTLADAAASGPRPGHRTWPHIGNQAAGPGQTVPQAITIASRPPEETSGREPAVSLVGRGVAGS